jgi:hypothetical protein
MIFIASIVYLIPNGSVDGKVKEKKSSCSKTVCINIFIVHKDIVVKHTDARGTALPPPFLTFYLHIYVQSNFFIISSLFS